MLVAIKNTFDSLLNLISSKADITYVDNAISGNSIPAGSRLANIQAMSLPNGQIIKGGVGTAVTAFNIDNALSLKSNSTDVYTKTESDGRYYLKSQTYTKTESDGKYRLITDTYTKTESDNKYRLKSDSYTKTEVNAKIVIATTAEAQAGTNNIKLMTPLRVKEAITNQVVGITNLTNYYTKTQTDGLLNNKVNISNFNKAGIGLGNVENYGIATQPEIQANVSDLVNDKYMTPLRSAQQIDFRRRFATLAETNAGILNSRIISPLRLKEQFNLLSDYIDDKIEQITGTG